MTLHYDDQTDDSEINLRLQQMLAEGAEDAYLALLELMAKPVRERDDTHWEALDDMLPEPPWTWVPLDALCHFGLIEFGVTMRTGWLTPAGNAALAYLRAWGTDVQDWERRQFEAKGKQ